MKDSPVKRFSVTCYRLTQGIPYRVLELDQNRIRHQSEFPITRGMQQRLGN